MRKKNIIINSLFILLFIGTVLTIFSLRNHGWDYANLMFNYKNTIRQMGNMDIDYRFGIADISSDFDDLLTSNDLNNDFKSYLQEKVVTDSTTNLRGLTISDIDGYKTNDSSKKNRLSHLFSFSNNKINNIANVDYDDKNFTIQLKPHKMHFGLYSTMIIFDLIIFLVLLTLTLKKNSKYRNYLRMIYIAWFLKMFFSFMSLFSTAFIFVGFWSHLSEIFVLIIFILMFYKLFATYHPILPYLLIFVTLIDLWYNLLLFSFIYFAVCSILIIFSRKGINKKIYLIYLFFILLYISSIIVILISSVFLESYIGSFPFRDSVYYSGFLFPMNFLRPDYGILFSITTGPLFLLGIIVLTSMIYRMLQTDAVIVEKVYYWVLKLYLIFFLISLTLGIYFLNYSPELLRTIALGLMTLIFYYIISKYLKLFPFINPLRFDVQKKLVKLLNASYNHTNHAEYSNFFLSFLKKIQPKAKISIISKEVIIGDEFPKLEYSRLEEVINLKADNQKYINLDLELLDDTEIGKLVKDFNNSAMPHLLYPIYNNKEELQAVIAFGKFPGIYWQKSLAEAIYKLVEVFSGFYLNILVQERYLEQGKAIVKEQEEKVYNQKLAELKTQQNEELKAEKKLITESIEYAARIQKSLVPQAQELDSTFENYFVIWQQRDIVGGDLYWAYKILNSDDILFSVIDCTGHGIPGALMSVTANSSLERITKEHECYEPNLILNQMHQGVGNTLHQAEQNTQQDGMDMSIIKYNKKSRKLQFAGANHNLILVKASTQELIVIKGDRYSIGGLKWKNEINFNSHEIQLEKGDTIYLFSDGIVDQPYNKSENRIRRLGTKDWYNFLVENNQQSMDKIKTDIEELIAEMIEISPQRDDICIVGIRG